MNLFGPICTVFLLHTHLFVFCRLFSMPKMNMQVDWTETAKKQECMRNILYMLYNLQPNHRHFISSEQLYVFCTVVKLNHNTCYRASLLHVWVTAALFVLFVHLYILFKCLYLLFRLPFLYIRLYNRTVQAFLMVSSNHNVFKSAIVC